MYGSREFEWILYNWKTPCRLKWSDIQFFLLLQNLQQLIIVNVRIRHEELHVHISSIDIISRSIFSTNCQLSRIVSYPPNRRLLDQTKSLNVAICTPAPSAGSQITINHYLITRTCIFETWNTSIKMRQRARKSFCIIMPESSHHSLLT